MIGMYILHLNIFLTLVLLLLGYAAVSPHPGYGMSQAEYPGNGYAPYAQYQCGAAYPAAYPPPAPSGYSPGACYSMPPPQHLPPHDKAPKDPK